MYDKLAWKKHEDVWYSIINPDKISLDDYSTNLEKYIIPPNDQDILLSHFYYINDISFNIVFDDKIENLSFEINKWKTAYKKVVLRWHPDKLIPILKKIKINDDTKNLLFKKVGSIINNMNKFFKFVIYLIKNNKIQK